MRTNAIKTSLLIFIYSILFAHTASQATSLTLEQISNIVYDVTMHFKASTRTAQLGDRPNTCVESQKALQLYHTIDPADFPPQVLEN